jgi:hypothetical protein
MSNSDGPKSFPLIDTLDRTAKTYSNVKTLTVAAASAIGAIFAAGIYYNELRHTLKDYQDRVKTLEDKQSALSKQLDDLSNKQSAEKSTIRVAINKAFADLVQIKNGDPPFRNTEPLNNGGGNSPTVPPGRCATGQVVVGVGPYKETNGVRSIDMQCGVVPLVKVD